MSDVKQSEQKSNLLLQNGSGAGTEQQNESSQTSVWEWVTGGLGLLLVLGAILFVLYNAIWGSETPPDARIKVRAIQPISNGYLVQFEVMNQSGSTMAGVVISGALKQSTEEVESSQTTINFLPANSTRKGGFFFRKNPQEYKLETKVLGYQEP